MSRESPTARLSKSSSSSRLRKKQVKGTQLRAARHQTPPAGRSDAGSLAATSRRRRPESSGGASCRTLRQVPDAHQVVDRQAEDEHPPDAPAAAVARLPKQADGLEPAEDLFDPLALLLTHLVAGVARGAPIDRARTVRGVLGHVRGHLQQAQGSDEVARVIGFVGRQGDPARHRHRPDHLERGGALAVAVRGGEAAVDRETVAILHQHVPLVAELGFTPGPLAVQERLRVGRGGMGRVAAPLAVEIHGRIPRIVRGGRRRVLALETLEARPSVDQGAVDREMLVGEQPALLGLGADPLEKSPRDVAAEQPFPILREHRGVPDRVIHGQAHEPPEEQVVVELLHEEPLAAHAVEHLQEQGPQQVLGRDRRPPDLGIQLVELGRQFAQDRVAHGPQGAQGMVGRDASLQRHIPSDHPLRPLRAMGDTILGELSPQFDQLYSKVGRPSIPPEHLLRALLLQVLYSVRSERLLMEQLDYNLLFRWFVGLAMDDPIWDATVFTKNRERLLRGDIARAFFERVRAQAEQRGLLSDEHFTVDGTLIDAWASLKSFQRKDAPPPVRDDPGNPTVNFHGERRSNATNASTTDPQARLYRKGDRREAKLCYQGHVLMENRDGPRRL